VRGPDVSPVDRTQPSTFATIRRCSATESGIPHLPRAFRLSIRRGGPGGCDRVGFFDLCGQRSRSAIFQVKFGDSPKLVIGIQWEVSVYMGYRVNWLGSAGPWGSSTSPDIGERAGQVRFSLGAARDRRSAALVPRCGMPQSQSRIDEELWTCIEYRAVSRSVASAQGARAASMRMRFVAIFGVIKSFGSKAILSAGCRFDNYRYSAVKTAVKAGWLRLKEARASARLSALKSSGSEEPRRLKPRSPISVSWVRGLIDWGELKA
jgi:hypothetical protein